ncbi:hypothetical protein ARTSIC4J27_1190 [Pseudarthrobacter siccitolerans]|uniref:Uncharacterized protein n=1 Tax=Pseudarthrobacter siccitolerans TaxID=861266 RepID=A0A024H047_9MICC|nr:hypothetical protein ARTSIC4J27_1190 [Pseudarthrobacter siccitolerans]
MVGSRGLPGVDNFCTLNGQQRPCPAQPVVPGTVYAAQGRS